jgi:phage/plasmid-like protein (TIGR03299 family)
MSNKLVSLDDRVGTDISKARDFADVMNTAGFDFNVEKVKCHTPEGNALTGHYVLRREDTKHVLGVVRERYVPIPMDRMFEPFHDLVTDYGASYETAGVIDGGKKCWISALLPNDFKLKNREDDVIKQRIFAFGSNDGTKRNAYSSIAHRLMCNNQLNLIMTSASKSAFGMSHTKNWEDQWVLAQANFQAALDSHKEFEKVANILDDNEMTVGQARGFATELLPDRVYDDKKERRKTNRIVNRREQIVDLFVGGAGNRGATRWDALNAVTEYLDHHNQAKKLEGKNGFKNAQRRFVSNNFGGLGDRVKQKALHLLCRNSLFANISEPQYTNN